MSIVSENPCFVGRAACATDCARRFARAFVQQYRRRPSYDQIAAHVPGFNTYTRQHQSNILGAGGRASRLEMERIIPCPNMMREECDYHTPLFAHMGYELSLNFNADRGEWRLCANSCERDGTVARRVEKNALYFATSVQNLYFQIATKARELAANDVAA